MHGFDRLRNFLHQGARLPKLRHLRPPRHRHLRPPRHRQAFQSRYLSAAGGHALAGSAVDIRPEAIAGDTEIEWTVNNAVDNADQNNILATYKERRL